MSLSYDSVFTGSIPFESDRPLIPVDEIISGLDDIKTDSTRGQTSLLDRAIEALVQQALPLVERQDIKAVQSLELPALRIELQRPILDTWVKGFELGQRHGQKEIVSALPDEDRVLFSLTPRQRQAVDRLLKQDNQTLSSVGAEQSILQRAMRLSGKFSEDIINRLKTDLIASIIPGESGDPISRSELRDRISKSLGVGASGAERIARTETTNAYNAGRLTTFKDSRIVGYVRFLAITDPRTTRICFDRNGLVFPIDSPDLEANRPPLHPNCRSVLSPLMPGVNPLHDEIVNDPNRDPSRRAITPLARGWKT